MIVRFDAVYYKVGESQESTNDVCIELVGELEKTVTVMVDVIPITGTDYNYDNRSWI